MVPLAHPYLHLEVSSQHVGLQVRVRELGILLINLPI
jgi:hypothetical protein